MQVLLRVNTASKPEKKIKVSRDVLIGRERGRCDLRVASSEVSRRHCQILVGEKTVDVRDLGSANGTRVNGELIPAKMNFPINPGDLLVIGPLEVTVEFRAKKRSRPEAESEDDFLSQDNALAALDAPAADMEHSAAEILIESRLIDSGDSYGSGLKTVDASEPQKAGTAAESEAFDSSSDDHSTPEQIAPLEADEVPDLEPIETLEPLDEEPASPVLNADPPALELEPAEPASVEPASVEPIPLNAVSEEPEPANAEPADTGDQKTGGLKSLFGRFGRRKDAAEAPSEPKEARSESEMVPDEAIPTEPVVSPAAVATAQADAQTTPADLEPPSVDLAVPDGGEIWEPPEGEWEADDEDELVSVEDIGSVEQPLGEVFDDVEELVELEDGEEDAPPADKGFADFLNQLDEPT